MDYKAMAAAIKLCGSTPKVEQCKECPYWDDGDMNKCIPRMTQDAATAITDLLARAEKAEGREKNLIEAVQMITARAEKAERERDAAISDLTYIARTYPVDLCDDLVCQYCKHYPNVNTGCPGFTENDCFEWRGQKEE